MLLSACREVPQGVPAGVLLEGGRAQEGAQTLHLDHAPAALRPLQLGDRQRDQRVSRSGKGAEQERSGAAHPTSPPHWPAVRPHMALKWVFSFWYSSRDHDDPTFVPSSSTGSTCSAGSDALQQCGLGRVVAHAQVQRLLLFLLLLRLLRLRLQLNARRRAVQGRQVVVQQAGLERRALQQLRNRTGSLGGARRVFGLKTTCLSMILIPRLSKFCLRNLEFLNFCYFVIFISLVDEMTTNSFGNHTLCSILNL